ncbi:Cullin-1 [Acorus gramineus]|uniref:Cullin-1 n=1 Tax=Acorus gramineus TaxID=55184 RepID=A0AAV9BS28_ACOGR|nr:Cullin-1 [Acorus gramineus]
MKEDMETKIERGFMALNEAFELMINAIDGNAILGEQAWPGFSESALEELIHQEREGEWLNESVVKVQANLFVSVTDGELEEAYENDFERELLARTVTYYAGKAAKISTTSLADYMIMVEDCLKWERYIANRYFPPSTELKLLEMEDLSRMFALFSKIDKGLDSICDKFLKCIIEDGIGLIKQAEDKSGQKKDFVGRLIELHVKYMNYVENCFESHSIFRKALRDAFELLCNKTVDGNSISEIVCFYIDNILKKGGGKSEKLKEPIEETFDKIIGLLNYVQGKDLFAEFYRNKLASRLLNGSSTSDDNERSLLTKIKLQFGMQLTSKMEGMITDMTLAREKQTEFVNYLDAFPQEHPGVDLTVTVLTTGFWPTYNISYPEIPQEMGSCIEAYKSFYTCVTRKHTLTWLFSLGTCIMTGKFDARPIEMSLTTYQAVLLLLFNDCDRLSFREIASQLKLPNDEVLRLLHSLSCSKYKILNKEPNNKIISVRDVFEFNPKFNDKMRRIKIPTPPLCEKKKVIEEVDKDRRYEIDAAIVRIMKSRKVLAYQLLISECIQQLSARFVPDVKVIKKRIEELIARDFLERDTTDSDAFRYLP